MIYLGAPILVGWGIGLLAVRQRLRAVWPAVGLILIALIGGTGQVHAHPPAAPGGLPHVSMGFTLAPAAQSTPDGLLHAMMLLSIMALPYLIWRLQQAFWRSA